MRPEFVLHSPIAPAGYPPKIPTGSDVPWWFSPCSPLFAPIDHCRLTDRLLNRARSVFAIASCLRVQAVHEYIVLAIALAFAYHFLFITNSPNGPPLVRGPLPFLGAGLSFLRDPENFL